MSETGVSFSSLVFLVVDDDPVLRTLVGRILEKSGARVLLAAGGREAWGLLGKHSVSFIVSDIRMAEGDGLELLRAVREAQADFPPMILMTGYSDVSIAECLRRGAQGVLLKPFPVRQLTDLIQEILSKAPYAGSGFFGSD